MKDHKHAAFVRDDSGNLQVRHFPSAADAARAAATLEAPEIKVTVPMSDETKQRRRPLDHHTFARRTGVPSRLIRAAFKRGAFPGAVAHSERLIHIPARFVALVDAYGVMGVERRIKAGLLS